MNIKQIKKLNTSFFKKKIITEILSSRKIPGIFFVVARRFHKAVRKIKNHTQSIPEDK